MNEDYYIKDPKVDDLINRLRFKLPEYDTISNYKRLQERINTPVISLSKNISPAWKWFPLLPLLLFWLFQPFTLLT